MCIRDRAAGAVRKRDGEVRRRTAPRRGLRFTIGAWGPRHGEAEKDLVRIERHEFSTELEAVVADACVIPRHDFASTRTEPAAEAAPLPDRPQGRTRLRPLCQ